MAVGRSYELEEWPKVYSAKILVNYLVNGECRVWLYGKCFFTAVEAAETVELRAGKLETRGLHRLLSNFIWASFLHDPILPWGFLKHFVMLNKIPDCTFFRSCNFLQALITSAPNTYERIFPSFFPLKNFTILIPPTWPIRTFFLS